MGKISERWRELAKIYSAFARSSKSKLEFDLSRQALQAQIDFESRGIKNGSNNIFATNTKINGFAYGQSQLELHIAMWSEDIATGCLLKGELFEDLKENQFLNKILPYIKERLSGWHMGLEARAMREDLLGIECQKRGVKWISCQ